MLRYNILHLLDSTWVAFISTALVGNRGVPETLKPMREGDSEVIEICRLVGVTIWGEMDSLLSCRDCFIKISNVPEMLKPTLEGHSEAIETSRLARVII